MRATLRNGEPTPHAHSVAGVGGEEHRRKSALSSAATTPSFASPTTAMTRLATRPRGRPIASAARVAPAQTGE